MVVLGGLTASFERGTPVGTGRGARERSEVQRAGPRAELALAETHLALG